MGETMTVLMQTNDNRDNASQVPTINVPAILTNKLFRCYAVRPIYFDVNFLYLST